MRRGPFPQWVSIVVGLWSLIVVIASVVAIARGQSSVTNVGAAMVWTVILTVSVYGFISRRRLDRRQ